MNTRDKRLERILILRTIINYGGEMPAAEIADRASTECDHDLLEQLAPVSRRGIGQKLQAMHADGLVAGYQKVKFDPLVWAVTRKGIEMAESIGVSTRAGGCAVFSTDYVRSVNGYGARCGCGGQSVLHVGTQLGTVAPATSRFLCRACVGDAISDHFENTGQPSYWPGDEKRDEPYERPENVR